jgi:hypothetical protein
MHALLQFELICGPGFASFVIDRLKQRRRECVRSLHSKKEIGKESQ